jgi:succinate dehydrogenase/fumarate reductase flavoprotein subunit
VIGINTKTGKILSDAVVIASGGFENNIVMQKNYWQGKPVLNYGVTSNTGDGIKACQAVGAELSHMWHYHGGFGFKHPDGFGCEIKGVNAWSLAGSTPKAVKKLYHIIVDQNGRRFMNEHPPNVNDTGYRPFECFTPEETKYNRIPAYFISDSNGKASGPFGSIRTHRDHAKEKYVGWSHSNDKELELGIIKKFDSLDAVSTHIGCDVDVLTHTLDHYNNDVCKNGDNQFKRPSVSLLPITNPPYYVGEIYPMVGNTQGGPKKNQHFQVLDVFDHPINGLYTTGECGSIFNHLYLSSGNFAECFVGSAVITKHLTK